MNTYKKVLVIGSTGYIGQSITKTLINKNISITGSYFFNKPLVNDPNNNFLPLDIKSDDSIDQFLKLIQNEKYDSLIFSAATLEKEVLEGMNKGSYMANMDSSIAGRYIEANSTKLLRLIKGILPSIKTTPYSNIIFLGSLVGKKALNAPPAFSIGKSCINGLVESLSKELGPSNIKVNLPGGHNLFSDLRAEF